MKYQRFLFLAVFIWGLGALAGGLETAYRTETKKLLLKLEQLGVKEIACDPKKQCLTPQGLIHRLETLKFVPVKFHKSYVEDATRWGAFYAASENTVFLNTEVTHDPRYIAYLGFHELLGIMGSPEPDFSLSLTAYKLISSYESADPRESESSWRHHIQGYFPALLVWDLSTPDLQWANNVLFLESGVFIGGGAGDIETFKIRAQVLRQVRKYFPTLPLTEMEFFLPNIAIEIVNNKFQDVDFSSFAKTKIPGYRLSPSITPIFVPRALLNQSSVRDPSVSLAVDDIAWFIASLYPQYSGLPTHLDGYHPQAVRYFWCSQEDLTSEVASVCAQL